jgi:hypothetical protein
MLKLGHDGFNKWLDVLRSLWVCGKFFGEVVNLTRKNLITGRKRALQHFALNHFLNVGDLAALHRVD